MSGNTLKYRHLSRSSAHRQALLRNLVTSLISQESIQTTWHKAKEAQKLAEKLITLGKKNTNASRARAEQILFTPLKHINKVFGELRERYADRPGGYTRVLRIESMNKNNDQAASAILELVDGPKDVRFAMTARSLVKERAAAAEDESKGVRDITARNILKVTKYRGEEALLKEVERLEQTAASTPNASGQPVSLPEKVGSIGHPKWKKDMETWERDGSLRRRLSGSAIEVKEGSMVTTANPQRYQQTQKNNKPRHNVFQ